MFGSGVLTGMGIRIMVKAHATIMGGRLLVPSALPAVAAGTVVPGARVRHTAAGAARTTAATPWASGSLRPQVSERVRQRQMAQLTQAVSGAGLINGANSPELETSLVLMSVKRISENRSSMVRTQVLPIFGVYKV